MQDHATRFDAMKQEAQRAAKLYGQFGNWTIAASGAGLAHVITRDPSDPAIAFTLLFAIGVCLLGHGLSGLASLFQANADRAAYWAMMQFELMTRGRAPAQIASLAGEGADLTVAGLQKRALEEAHTSLLFRVLSIFSYFTGFILAGIGLVGLVAAIPAR